MSTQKRPKFVAFCDVCYSWRHETTSKRDANQAAVHHMNQYQHSTHVQPIARTAPVVDYASSETAYGRTVPASFAIKVF